MTDRDVDFIIHIGYSKTGTTSVQNFLSLNRKVLIERGILHPDIRYKGSWLGVNNHNLVARSLSGMKGWFRLSPTKFLAQIDRQIRQEPRVRTVLLSAENFAGEPGPWRFATSDEYVEAESRNIAELHRLLGGRSARMSG